ncbi:MAG: DHA2 family efflux MFS transporter permease subunit [Actinomycetales bacterium]|nr:DHA2 family efflux MFS transporter permease subunit [Actinomycetales bacterium]
MTDSTSPRSRRRWLSLVVISVAVALIIVDSTIVNVAIPSVVDELSLSSTQVQWVQESYTLVFAALLLVLGTLGDRFGRRRILLAGVSLFALASIAAALAPTGEFLIAARVVQGLGGAAILPSTLSIINSTFTGRERGIAFAVWGSTIGGMAAVGPLLGGWLTTAFSWRWAFGINIPLGVLLVIGILVAVAESRGPQDEGIDLVGAAISVVLFTSLVFGLIEGRTYGWFFSDTPPDFWTWSISPIPFSFAIAALALVAFVLWGRAREKRGKTAMVPIGLLRIPSFRNGNITATIVALGEFGIILSLPLWLQDVLGYDALGTGFVLLALAGGSFLASGFAGASSGRIPAVWVVRAGLVAEVAGLIVIGSVIAVDTPWWWIAIGLAIYGFGVGLATAQLTSVILVDVPVEASGRASGTQSTARQVGSALGIAILGTVLFGSLGSQLSSQLPDAIPADSRTQIVDAVVGSAGGAIPQLEQSLIDKAPNVPGIQQIAADAADAARASFSDATRIAAFTAAGFLALGLVFSASLGSGRARDEDAEGDATQDGTPAATGTTH